MTTSPPAIAIITVTTIIAICSFVSPADGISLFVVVWSGVCGCFCSSSILGLFVLGSSPPSPGFSGSGCFTFL